MNRCLNFLLLFFLTFTAFTFLNLSKIYGQVTAIAGGEHNNYSDPYVVTISPLAVAGPISGPGAPTEPGYVQGVDINAYGESIFGGAIGGEARATLVSTSSIATPISGIPTGGSADVIDSVAINDQGNSIIGGRANDDFYAALVSPSGVATTLTQLPSSPGTGPGIGSVALNSSNYGVIGGSTTPNLLATSYAALVSPSGVATNITGPGAPGGQGIIFSVDINDSGTVILGGNNNGPSNAYAALVYPDGTVNQLSVPTGAPVSVIFSAAINASGSGVIGGFISGNQPYVARFSPSGALTPITGLGIPSGDGRIIDVAINDSGTVLVGGRHINDGTPYAALISPTDVVTNLALPPGQGSIISVDLHSSGVGIIGGPFSGNGFVALVSPSGVLTPISGLLPGSGAQIYTVAIRPTDIVPEVVGPGNSFTTSIFPLTTQVLPSHDTFHHKVLPHLCKLEREKTLEENPIHDAKTDNLNPSDEPCFKREKYLLWAAPYGDYAHQKKEQHFPAITNWTGGVMMGFDYRGITNTTLGVGAAYNYNDVHYSDKKGHASVNQEFLTLYGSWMKNHLFINAGLWGGLYQIHNKRKTIEILTSTSNINGWLLIPHLEVSLPYEIKDHWLILDPFIMFDWANNWQGKIREHGSSGFNLRVDNHYVSVLRTELGINLFQILKYGWGSVIFKEKGSYVNEKPFNAHKVDAYFVDAFSSFEVAVFSDKVKNLGVFELTCRFIPARSKYVYGGIGYQGEFGASFQSHCISLEIGKYF
ncbi:MAG: autotransporter outer membrane beta-barrel domain-containing protein [Chlamydiales bacterium]|nr:autotransporter outer membrane beta-barrel domain-containing protein [Chlamydiia bacterium]MCP5505109.1 autotransporter outer membrane beta-barrel domain-containing protein [Chlamydiales bacterium]